MRLLRNALLVALFGSIFVWAAWYTIVRFSNPALTETQVMLETWGAIIPIATFGLLVAIVEYMMNRRINK